MTRGISTRKTSLGFDIFRLHYTSDPDKSSETEAGRAWLEQAKQGMSDARWRKEFEIDYGAMGGELVFPEFEPGFHVVEPFELNPEHWTIWMACDPHPRTPHAFLWLAVNSEDDMVIPTSWWPSYAVTPKIRATVREYADCVEYIEKEHGFKVYKRLMDVAGKGMNATEEHTFFDAYRDAGVSFYPAKKNRDLSGFELINGVLQPLTITIGNETKTRPRLTIMRGNDELVWQLGHLRFSEWRANATDKDPPERTEEKRKHLVDCLAYILLDEPRFVRRGGNASTFKAINPTTGY